MLPLDGAILFIPDLVMKILLRVRRSARTQKHRLELISLFASIAHVRDVDSASKFFPTWVPVVMTTDGCCRRRSLLTMFYRIYPRRRHQYHRDQRLEEKERKTSSVDLTLVAWSSEGISLTAHRKIVRVRRFVLKAERKMSSYVTAAL